MKLSTVIIPWHRNLADLNAAVASVLAQDDPDFEVVVVANGVGDDDFQAAVALCGDPRCRVERMAAADAAASRNLGLELARGDLVFFLDADDTFLPAKLSTFRRAAARKPFDLAMSRGERTRGDGTSWAFPTSLWDGSESFAEYSFCGGNNISTSAIVLSRDAARRLSFSPPPFQDPDLVMQAEALGMTIAMLPDVLYRWNDAPTPGRISLSIDVERRLAWIGQPRPNVPPRARRAFRARNVAQHIFPQRPLWCLGAFAAAGLTGAVSPRHVGMFVLRGLLPRRVSRRLVNVYFQRRAAREL